MATSDRFANATPGQYARNERKHPAQNPPFNHKNPFFAGVEETPLDDSDFEEHKQYDFDEWDQYGKEELEYMGRSKFKCRAMRVILPEYNIKSMKRLCSSKGRKVKLNTRPLQGFSKKDTRRMIGRLTGDPVCIVNWFKDFSRHHTLRDKLVTREELEERRRNEMKQIPYILVKQKTKRQKEREREIRRKQRQDRANRRAKLQAHTASRNVPRAPSVPSVEVPVGQEVDNDDSSSVQLNQALLVILVPSSLSFCSPQYARNTSVDQEHAAGSILAIAFVKKHDLKHLRIIRRYFASLRAADKVIKCGPYPITPDTSDSSSSGNGSDGFDFDESGQAPAGSRNSSPRTASVASDLKTSEKPSAGDDGDDSGYDSNHEPGISLPSQPEPGTVEVAAPILIAAATDGDHSRRSSRQSLETIFESENEATSTPTIAEIIQDSQSPQETTETEMLLRGGMLPGPLSINVQKTIDIQKTSGTSGLFNTVSGQDTGPPKRRWWQSLRNRWSRVCCGLIRPSNATNSHDL